MPRTKWHMWLAWYKRRGPFGDQGQRIDEYAKTVALFAGRPYEKDNVPDITFSWETPPPEPKPKRRRRR